MGVNSLEKIAPRVLAEFKPEETLEVTSVLKAAAEHAARMRDWESLEKAVDWLAKRIKTHVAWYKTNVRKAGGDRQSTKALSRTCDNGFYTVEQTEKATKILKQTVARWTTRSSRPDFEIRLYKDCWRGGFPNAERADLQTGEMEWFTPPEYIEAARLVMGSIDLDPASSALAQGTIRARKYFTEKQDGLKQKWNGRVWLNPPYSGKLIAAFSAKMIEEWESGRVTAAIMLTNAYTETSWWHSLATASNSVCFTRGRIKFESPHGEKSAPTNGQSFFYLGKSAAKFHTTFKRFGMVMVKYD
jgi:ParB family chromosome partitioning protein